MCTVVDHRRRHSVYRTTVMPLDFVSCRTFFFFARCDVIYDLLQYTRTGKCNLFVKQYCILIKNGVVGILQRIELINHSLCFKREMLLLKGVALTLPVLTPNSLLPLLLLLLLLLSLPQPLLATTTSYY